MKKKFLITTTIPATLRFFKGNLSYLNKTYDVFAVSSQKEELSELGKEEDIETFFIPMKRSISLFSDMISLLRFIKLFIKMRPDIVHGNTPKASFLSMVAAKITGVKVRIYMCHGLRYQGTSGIMRSLLINIEKITSAFATEVICVSRGVRETMIEDGICDKNKAVVIHYGSAAGIDLDRFKNDTSLKNLDVRKEIGIISTDFVFVFVGRIVQDKGINELVQAFIKLQSQKGNVHLILVGLEERKLNPISEESRKVIENHNHIHAVGRQSDIRPYLLCSDAFVLPSYREGLCTVLIEAGAMGLPCITTDINGCNEIIIDNENGVIIPPKDEKKLLEAMLYFLDNPNEVERMSGNSRRLIVDKYEQHVVWDALLNEYKRLEKELLKS